MSICAFCGYTGKLTGEHVLGDWLSRIGLDLTPVPHGAGWLNEIGRDLGVRPPFRQTVQDVCGPCNNGWMSRLEDVAVRVLTPLILGMPGSIREADAAAVAAWVEKTALTAMLVSSEDERAEGYGLPESEYRQLYALRDAQEPLPASQLWVGRHAGRRDWAVRVTPLTVTIQDFPIPLLPQGYVMTVLLGKLVLQGVRFTTDSLQTELATAQTMAQFWPWLGSAAAPTGIALDDEGYFDFVGGKNLQSREAFVSVWPWTPATELPRSQLVGAMAELPSICGKHVVYYPRVLAEEASRGRYYAFVSSCECQVAYLIQSAADGAHCKAHGAASAIEDRYEALAGDDFTIDDEHGRFHCKRLT